MKKRLGALLLAASMVVSTVAVSYTHLSQTGDNAAGNKYVLDWHGGDTSFLICVTSMMIVSKK